MNASPSYAATCTACSSANIRIFAEIKDIPVHCNVLWPTKLEALHAPRGDMRMAFCSDCGHVFNSSFDPKLMEYTQAYENSLHFSPSFQEFAEGLARHLIERYHLRNKDIIDIGCGKGDFLKLISRMGGNRGYGFDPSYVPDESDKDFPVTFVQEFYSEAHTSYAADLVSCRHVLEHIQFPATFVGNVKRSIGNRPDTAIYFEVPNVLYTLRDMGIWDIIYEHCSYFSAHSLYSLFLAQGLMVNNVREMYGGQFLGLEAQPARNGRDSDSSGVNDLVEMITLIDGFGKAHREKIQYWQTTLNGLFRDGKSVALWGGGSKGVTFLNTFDTQGHIGFMVDINPRKQGMYVGGSGQQIVAPAFLKNHIPHVVIVMNPLYEKEIREQLHGLGIEPDIMVA